MTRYFFVFTLAAQLGFLVFACPSVFAHEDIDIGIESVKLNKNCMAEVVLINNGRNIPVSFYRLVNPASLSIEKAKKIELLGSISQLDREQNLRKSGGRLKLQSKRQYAETPQSMKVSLSFFGEYFDHGGDNNSLVEEIDCIVGQGQIKGEVNLPTRPDISLKNAGVNPKTCRLLVEFENISKVPLGDDAWGRAEGVMLMQLNRDTDERLANIDFVDIDRKKAFTRLSQQFTWENPERLSGVKSLRVALWRVKGDLDFSNNHIDLLVPKTCW